MESSRPLKPFELLNSFNMIIIPVLLKVCVINLCTFFLIILVYSSKSTITGLNIPGQKYVEKKHFLKFSWFEEVKKK